MPPDVSDEVSKDLASVMLDSAAVPGTSSSSSVGLDVVQQTSDLGLMGGALQEMIKEMVQECMGQERIEVDSQWGSTS
jgi:hypothetical protein